MLILLASAPNKGNFSNEYEAPGHFYIRLPSQINKLSIKGIGILRSDPHHPPLSENPSKRVSDRSIPAWPTSATPPATPVALSQVIGKCVLSLMAD